jgi:anaerobic selenocysteine-containing dehydrogenase
MKDPTRRKAIAGLGLLGLGAAGCRDRGWSPPEDDKFSRALVKPPVPGSRQFATGEERWIATSCAQCPAGCGLRVRVVEGRAVRVEGNRENPLNRGGVGPRGLSSLQGLYDPARIRGPMVRDGGKLIEASWDDALARVAGALAALRERGAPEKLLLWCGRERGVMRDLFARFAAAYGTPNLVDGRPARTAPIARAMEECLGTYETPAYDWGGVRQVLSLEAGLLEDTCQAVYFTRVAAELRRGRGDRARLIHAGAAFDLCAHNADRWLRIRPGTGGTLALGLCQVLIAEGRYDTAFVEARTEGFDALRALAARHTLEEVSQITGARPEDIAELARELWERRPSFALVDDRSVATSCGRETALAALSLNALLGAVDAPSGGIRVAPEAPLAPWPELERDEIATAGADRPRIDGAGRGRFAAARSVPGALPAALEAGAAEIALLYHADPVRSGASPEAWRRALARVPLVVSFSPYRDQSTLEVADVVLPDHTFLERWEDAAAAPGPTRSIVGVRRPAVSPLFDTRATGDVVLELSRRIGGAVAAATPWPRFKEALEVRLLGLRDAGGEPRAPDDRGFLEALYDRGLWSATSDQPPRQLRFNFVAEAATPRWDGDPETFPLLLVPYRPLGSGVDAPWLQTLRPRPWQPAFKQMAVAHPSAATGTGVASGDRVAIESPHGRIEIALALDERIEPGAVLVPLGRGGDNPMALVAPVPVAETGATPLAATRARIARLGGRS